MPQGRKKLTIRKSPGLFYRLLRSYADPAFLASYTDVQYVGLENIPKDCAVIVAPNHSNGLMDPLAAMSLGRCPGQGNGRIAPMIFAARADMFRIPGLGRLLLSLYVTPVLRIRDGFSHLRENAAIIDEVSDRLCDGIPYCIMAEGTQRDRHSLLPLVKGIFRVALQTDDKLAGKRPVLILPVGIGYGNYYRYRTSMLINVGKPMNVSEYRLSHPELTQPELMNSMRDDLSARMSSLFFCIDDDSSYDGVLELCNIVTEHLLHGGSPDGRFTLYERMLTDKSVIAALYAMRDGAEPAQKEEYASLVSLGEEASGLRRSLHISASSYSGLHRPLLSRQFQRKSTMFSEERNFSSVSGSTGARAAVLALTLPYWLFSVAVTSPVLVPVEILCRVQEDRAFLISLRYAVAAFTLPLLWIVYAVLLAVFLPLRLWWLSALLLLLFVPAYTFAHDWFKQARLMLSDFRYRRCSRLGEIAAEVRSRMAGKVAPQFENRSNKL